MKIVCDACQAKYSISDDKVQGKVFKIRCKKCSNIIVVRGGAGAAEAPAAQEKDTRVYDYGADAGDPGQVGDESVWHVVINQDQVGPMTVAEVQQRFAAGEIDAETYAWREGFADWLPLSQVDAFAAFVASGGATAAVASSSGGGGAAAVSAMFGGGGGGDEGGTMRSDPGDLFASASASAASHGDDDGGDLFGTSKPAASRAQDAANAKLRGERNENSVLFSLNNLAQLASDKPAPASASVQSMPSGHATGAAGGEGSGLIDIRSMANAYLGSPGGAAKPVSAGIGSIDDLPVFGGGGFSEPAVIVPMAARSSNNKMMYALIGSIGALAVAAVIVIVILLKGGKSEDKNPQVAAKETSAAASDDKKADHEDKGDKPSDKPSEKPTEAKATDTAKPADTAGGDTKPADDTAKPADSEKPADSAKPTKPAAATTHHTSTPAAAKHTETAVASKTPKETAPPPPKDTGGGGGCDEVSCVLNNYEGACCSKFKKGGKGGGGGGGTAAKSTGGGGGGDLPDALDRAMISDGVAKVKARVMACGDKSTAKGQVKVSVKVNPDGHVGSVSVKATPDPGLGSCVAGAMQKATFAKTSGGGSFSYPFVF